jgi:oligoribonuclease NrnB/cAMP/cGMP phosphodiesterase (DHH superfamily)
LHVLLLLPEKFSKIERESEEERLGNMLRKIKSHNDLDGVGVGILAKIAWKENVEVQYCAYNLIDKHVSRFLSKKENKNVLLYITDISVNKQNELELQKRYEENQKVKLIDHHFTAMHFNQYDWATVKTEHENGKKSSATSLFFDYLLKNGHLKENPALNEFVELVRSYDTWDWDEDGNIKAKQLNDLFFMIGISNFEENMIERLLGNKEGFEFNQTEKTILKIEEGKIQRYLLSKEKQIVEKESFGYRMGIVSAEQYQSEVGNYLAKVFPFLDCIAMINHATKKISFRTIHEHIDVSKVAREFDEKGGGHKKASGCILTDLAFEVFVASAQKLKPRKPDPELNKYNIKGSEYGVIYENHDNEKYYLIPDNEGWNIYHDDERLPERFESFEEAEIFVKRNFTAWLSMDDVLINYFALKHGVKEQTLRSQFKRTMEEIMK